MTDEVMRRAVEAGARAAAEGAGATWLRLTNSEQKRWLLRAEAAIRAALPVIGEALVEAAAAVPTLKYVDSTEQNGPDEAVSALRVRLAEIMGGE